MTSVNFTTSKTFSYSIGDTLMRTALLAAMLCCGAICVQRATAQTPPVVVYPVDSKDKMAIIERSQPVPALRTPYRW